MFKISGMYLGGGNVENGIHSQRSFSFPYKVGSGVKYSATWIPSLIFRSAGEGVFICSREWHISVVQIQEITLLHSWLVSGYTSLYAQQQQQWQQRPSHSCIRTSRRWSYRGRWQNSSVSSRIAGLRYVCYRMCSVHDQ